MPPPLPPLPWGARLSFPTGRANELAGRLLAGGSTGGGWGARSEHGSEEEYAHEAVLAEDRLREPYPDKTRAQLHMLTLRRTVLRVPWAPMKTFRIRTCSEHGLRSTSMLNIPSLSEIRRNI